MPVLGTLLYHFCFERQGLGGLCSHQQAATLTGGWTAPGKMHLLGNSCGKETFLQGNWDRLVSKECLKNTLHPQQESLVDLHIQRKRVSNIDSGLDKFIWTGEKQTLELEIAP